MTTQSDTNTVILNNGTFEEAIHLHDGYPEGYTVDPGTFEGTLRQIGMRSDEEQARFRARLGVDTALPIGLVRAGRDEAGDTGHCGVGLHLVRAGEIARLLSEASPAELLALHDALAETADAAGIDLFGRTIAVPIEAEESSGNIDVTDARRIVRAELRHRLAATPAPELPVSALRDLLRARPVAN